MIAIRPRVYFSLLGPSNEKLGNGNLESLAGADDWNDWGGEDGGVQLQDEGVIVHGGTHALKAIRSLWDVAIFQEEIVVPGERYRLSFWTRGDGSVSGVYQVSITGGGSGDIIPATATGIVDTTYALYEVEFIIPDGGVWKIRIHIHNPMSTGTAYFDDISLVELVPTVTENFDVLQEPPPMWEFGLPGHGELDLVADTGVALLYLDNSSSNGAGLAGLYSPDHANALLGFGEGMLVRIDLDAPGIPQVETRFTGRIAAIRPASGLFEHPVVEVEVHDWMGYLSTQEVGIQTVAADKRADEALTTLLAGFPVQPQATDFDTGVETFPIVFRSESPETSMAGIFQKLAVNEQGRIYLEADGTLVFENRHSRPMGTLSDFTLDGLMGELDVSYERADIWNIIQARTFEVDVDAAATTLLWDLAGSHEILAGKSLVFQCNYTDPATGKGISGIEIADPPVYEFGSVQDFVSDDMHTDLGVSMEIGGNAVIVTLFNNHAWRTGYLNDLQIKGKGVYIYDAAILIAEDELSIDTRGERKFPFRLDLLADPNKAQAYAEFILGKAGNPHIRAMNISFLANRVVEPTANIILNPSFEIGLANWAAMGILDTFERVTGEALYGVACAHLADAVGTGANEFIRTGFIAVTPNAPYTISASIKKTVVDGADTGELEIWWYTAVGGFISATTITFTGGDLTEWTDFFATGTSPATAAKVRVVVSGDGITGAWDMWVDGIQLEQKDHPTPTAIGDMGFGHDWDGAAHNSICRRRSSVFAEAALGLEISTRFTAIEAVTGVSKDFYVNRLRYRQVSTQLFVDILAVPVTYGTFIWDFSHWDTDDAHWAI